MHNLVEQGPYLGLPDTRSGDIVVDWFSVEMGQATVYGWTGVAGWGGGDFKEEWTEDDPWGGIEIGCEHPFQATVLGSLNASVGEVVSRRGADECGIALGEGRLGGISGGSERDVGEEVGDEGGLGGVFEEELVGCAAVGCTAFCVTDYGGEGCPEGLEEGPYLMTLLGVTVHELVLTAFT